MATMSAKRHASNYLMNIGDEPEQILNPIKGYASQPIVSLERACAPLQSIIPDLNEFVNNAKIKSKDPANNLTQDESAAIRLYTMQWNQNTYGSGASVYCKLNRTLRDPDRTKLKPWFLYLKLLLTALTKLPPTPIKTIYRGVRYQDVTKYEIDRKIVWWGFTSCTKNVTVLNSEFFLGKDGERKMFSIYTFDGRSIKDHSEFPAEDEVLLLPGTYLKIIGKYEAGCGLYFIQLHQKHPKEELLERPFTSNESRTYTIKEGDILWDIATKHHCTVEEIQKMNPGLDHLKLQIGQVIRLPPSAREPPPEIDSDDDSDPTVYRVCRGDTMERIAEWYNCSLAELINLNPSVRPSMLDPGQRLQLPINNRTKPQK